MSSSGDTMVKAWCLMMTITVVYSQIMTIANFTPQTITAQSYELNATYQIVLIYRNIPALQTINPFRIKTSTSTSLSKTKERLPILVVSQQEKLVTAWSMPLSVETTLKDQFLFFYNASKTMCHDRMDSILSDFSVLPLQISQSFIIALSTSSPQNVDINVELEEEKDFFVKLNRSYNLSVSPSEPRYVFFKYDENTTDTVVIEVDSEDEVCLTVSVQDSKCPVLDMNSDIKYEGIFQTINLKGAITLTKNKFKTGFFIVFVAKPDNYDCSQQNSYLPRLMRTVKISSEYRNTTVTFKVRNGISYRDYATAFWGTLSILAISGIILTASAILMHRFGTISKYQYNDRIVTDYFEALSEEQISAILKIKKLTVSHLSRHPKRIKKQSYNYLSHILSIALFYSIPVVQLVITYQRIVNQTGNEDMCYYNFLCAHPAFGMSDFNHVYSNFGYIIFGIMFIVVVMDRHRIVKMRKEKGIPVHYGLFHAMGVALVIEGLLSACYHICPSQANYQFDTSFMYVMIVLCMINLYQNRHPDITPTAYTTFTILGTTIFMATVGILNGDLAIWIIFIVCYSTLCVILSFKIYFLNYILEGLTEIKNTFDSKGLCIEVMNPIRRVRFIVLVFANLANYAMLIAGILLYKENETDFGTFLLGLLMGNAVIHVIFYTIMKLIHKEKICLEAACYGLLAIAAWASSGVFFLDPATLWTVTPAESRQWNHNCLLWNFFDKHDIWHLLSAPALYFTFMFLMCLDDDIIDKNQDEIPVF